MTVARNNVFKQKIPRKSRVEWKVVRKSSKFDSGFGTRFCVIQQIRDVSVNIDTNDGVD
jgi:hypothetical protein